MRLTFLFCFVFWASFVSADELLLPNTMTTHTEENAESINTQHNALINLDHKKTEPKKTASIMSAAKIAKIIEKQFSGKIVSVTLQEDSPVYAVKLLDNGHMKTIYLDANNGAITPFSD